MDWGQYVIAAFAPKISVGFDTRMDTCYPEYVVAMNYDFVLGSRPPGRTVKPERLARTSSITASRISHC